MPEYLAPGVFVEETSFRSKSIEGVSTSTTAFAGPTRRGPSGPTETPELLTSFADFERIYGGLNDLALPTSTDLTQTNYIAQAAMAFFNEGGGRLYVTRTAGGKNAQSDGIGTGSSQFLARFAGDFGNGTVVISVSLAPITTATMTNVVDGSFVLVKKDSGSDMAIKRNGVWMTPATPAVPATPGNPGPPVVAGTPAVAAIPAAPYTLPATVSGMSLVTLSVTATDNDGLTTTYDGLGLDPAHKRFIGTILHHDGNGREDHLTRFIEFLPGSAVQASDLYTAFTTDKDGKAIGTSKVVQLKGGTDVVPTPEAYTDAFGVLAGIDDISIVAAPGHTELGTVGASVRQQLIMHVEARRSYRIAVLDTPKGILPTEAKTYKGNVDSKYAALYYPWVVTPNPLFDPNDPSEDAELVLPPSGFVCGIYARSDDERGVIKSPANEVIRSALRFERLVNTGEQELLNPTGVNCLRYFAGRGHRVWGARTTSSDPEWKYVNVRRYFLYLEHSIDEGTQWAVFEPNGERLWANVRDTVTSFLYNEWVNGALLGDKPEQAFFVRCDRSTMTQNDLDNGRLICLIGVAVVKPAEFVIFRIGQKTVDARS